MKSAGYDPECDHHNHYDPAFDIKKRKRTIFILLLLDPLGMLVKQFLKYQIEEQKEYNDRLTNPEQLIV